MKRLINWFRRIIGIEQTIKKCNKILRLENELLQSQKFNSTICDSSWFRYRSLSPGGYAVDYAFLYTLYRTLSSVMPNNILEFGLGQSSKMIHQFACYYNKKAVTVEHDLNWKNFFLSSKEGDYDVNIKMLELDELDSNGHRSLTYKKCRESFQGERFDMIVVDGPFGGKHSFFSRPQILEIAKECLADKFVIIIDDYNRIGEKRTVEMLLSVFGEKGIEVVFGVYSGSKDHILITVPQYRFLTTL